MPYAPGIEYRGDQYLFRGISGLGEGLGGAIANYRQTQDESRAADAAMETLVRGAAPMFQDGQIPESLAKEMQDIEKFSGLSTSAKKAKLGQLGVTLQMLQQDAERKAREGERRDANDLRQSLFELRRTADDRAANQAAATQRMLRQAGPALMMPTDNTGVGSGYVDQALQDNPDADAAALYDLMAKTQAMRAKTAPEEAQGPLAFEEDPVTGARFARGGRSVLPSGMNPDKAKGQPTPLKDESGNVIGYNVGSGGKTQVMRNPSAVTTADKLKLMERKAELLQTMLAITNPEERAALEADVATIDAMIAGPSAGAGSPSQTPAPAGDLVTMTNPQGQKVRVPKARAEEARNKGYR